MKTIRAIRQLALTLPIALALTALAPLSAQAYYVVNGFQISPLQQIYLDTIYGDAFIYFWFGS